MTRGERNNNPGNIDYHKSIHWEGQLGIEIVPEGEHYHPRFARFDTMVHGIRALAKQILTNYRNRDCTTVRLMINRWAPPNENETTAYVNFVCTGVGVDPDDPIDAEDKDTLVKMVRAIICQENGRCRETDETLGEACELALA
jgi:hypothetical protein